MRGVYVQRNLSSFGIWPSNALSLRWIEPCHRAIRQDGPTWSRRSGARIRVTGLMLFLECTSEPTR